MRVHVPLSEATRGALEGRDRVASLAIRASRVEDVEPIRGMVEGWVTDRFGDADDFEVTSSQSMAAQARQGMLVFKLVMGSIAGISLLVGGIGIMNILLASVFERTREIGIRKASGARQADIRLQFLAEAVTITGAGSVIGVLIGLSGAFAITAGIRHLTEAPVQAAVTWGSILVAAVAALGVGLVFGTYPARRAARLSPIEAIRHE
ncbi:MAG: ABC transporter permease [Gemmatimonadota bacterium]